MESRPAPLSAALRDWLRLERVPGIGLLSARRLLDQFGTPGAIFRAPPERLRQLLRPAQATALARALLPDAAFDAHCDTIAAWLRTPGRHLLALDDPAYPAGLRQIADPPLLLYALGRPALLAGPALAVVGSRNASAQGLLNAERFAEALSHAGLTIVSGLALGIDAAAHRGGLRGAGATVAVVGTGADRIYPARNAALARQIAEQGCIVSEYPLGTPPRPENFPKRNRLISGLARGVLVVEAAAGSGSLITAKLALDQGREVYAIPGSIHSVLSKGCHALLREGATLVESADDILGQLGGAAPLPPDARFVDALLDAIGYDPVTADALAGRLGVGVAELHGQLLALELAGLLERLPGGIFQRVPG
ncbi:DNA-protecting protein DprA [Rugamonas sp. CCM 8940]|nr:DNA-protecting protein DprA [Rugamonas sp. CCM 8940]